MGRFICFCLLLGLPALAVSAESQEPQFSFEGLRLFGADFAETWQGWKLGWGAGYQEFDLGHDPDTGARRTADTEGSNSPYEAQWIPDATVQIAKLARWADWDLWLGLTGQGYGDFGTGSAASGLYPDWNGNSYGYVQMGVRNAHSTRGPHGIPLGTSIQATAEWAPSWASVRGTDYSKVRLQSGAELPLWNWDSDRHLFSGTMAFRANATWINGNRVPVKLLEATEVRGYYSLYDARFLTVGSAELRIDLPSLLDEGDIVPEVVTFADVGWGSDGVGPLAGVGAGFGARFWGFATPTLQLGVPLIGRNPSIWWKLFFDHDF